MPILTLYHNTLSELHETECPGWYWISYWAQVLAVHSRWLWLKHHITNYQQPYKYKIILTADSLPSQMRSGSLHCPLLHTVVPLPLTLLYPCAHCKRTCTPSGKLLSRSAALPETNVSVALGFWQSAMGGDTKARINSQLGLIWMMDDVIRNKMKCNQTFFQKRFKLPLFIITA